jgi:hypothetical protein
MTQSSKDGKGKDEGLSISTVDGIDGSGRNIHLEAMAFEQPRSQIQDDEHRFRYGYHRFGRSTARMGDRPDDLTLEEQLEEDRRRQHGDVEYLESKHRMTLIREWDESPGSPF